MRQTNAAQLRPQIRRPAQTGPPPGRRSDTGAQFSSVGRHDITLISMTQSAMRQPDPVGTQLRAPIGAGPSRDRQKQGGGGEASPAKAESKTESKPEPGQKMKARSAADKLRTSTMRTIAGPSEDPVWQCFRKINVQFVLTQSCVVAAAGL